MAREPNVTSKSPAFIGSISLYISSIGVERSASVNRAMSAFAAISPVLIAKPFPRFSSYLIILEETSGCAKKTRLAISAVPSVDPSSTTITSIPDSARRAKSITLPSGADRRSLSLYEGIMIEISGFILQKCNGKFLRSKSKFILCLENRVWSESNPERS